MRRLLRILAALSAITLHAFDARAQSPVAVRVLHWNVLHSGFGTDRVRDRARQVAWIVDQAPDVVTLNEVTASAAKDYRARIRAATGRAWNLHHVAAVAGSDGNAILSRFPMRATDGRVLTRARSVAQATIDIAGTPVNVFATHLESGEEAASRAAQVQRLLPYLASFSPPHIVNGDLNAGPDAGEIQPLLAEYVDAWERTLTLDTAVAYRDNPPNRYTRTRRARIDYILTSPEGTLRAIDCEIPDQRDLTNVNVIVLVRNADDKGVRPSDHNLVTCTLELTGAPRRRSPRQVDAGAPDDVEPPSVVAPEPAEGELQRPSDAVVPPAPPGNDEATDWIVLSCGTYRWTWAWWYAHTDRLGDVSGNDDH